jgi:hypothetical protein
MTKRPIDAQLDEIVTEHGQLGPDSGGQSGDTQGLSEIADAADESVEELAETGQDYEAEVIEGLEDAADHPEQPAHTHGGHKESPLKPASRRPSTI